jgi:tRNA G18 (ribose-2'-O)-methylase SpoU
VRGYCGIGVVNGKSAVNIGTLWRSATILGADFIFTVGRRYERQRSDTYKTWRHIPLWTFADFRDLRRHVPYDCQLVAVETIGETYLADFTHPERAVYLLGAEDHGLTREALAACPRVVRLPGPRSLNVATAGSIVLYDRVVKAEQRVQLQAVA